MDLRACSGRVLRNALDHWLIRRVLGLPELTGASLSEKAPPQSASGHGCIA